MTYGAHDLTRDFQSLPILDEPRTFWDGKRAELRQRIKNGDDPNVFLTWPTITSTMFVEDAPYIRIEYDALMSNDAARWTDAIREDVSVTRGNLIHQAYHLFQWEWSTGLRINSLKSISEIGGGYGAMAKVVRRLGFTGRYTIYDVPEFVLLQRFYLSQYGIEDIEFCVAPYPDWPDLMIALWSLGEMEEDKRNEYLKMITSRHILAAQIGNAKIENASIVVIPHLSQWYIIK